jgi:hypothetical protein
LVVYKSRTLLWTPGRTFPKLTFLALSSDAFVRSQVTGILNAWPTVRAPCGKDALSHLNVASEVVQPRILLMAMLAVQLMSTVFVFPVATSPKLTGALQVTGRLTGYPMQNSLFPEFTYSLPSPNAGRWNLVRPGSAGIGMRSRTLLPFGTALYAFSPWPTSVIHRIAVPGWPLLVVMVGWPTPTRPAETSDVFPARIKNGVPSSFGVYLYAYVLSPTGVK